MAKIQSICACVCVCVCVCTLYMRLFLFCSCKIPCSSCSAAHNHKTAVTWAMGTPNMINVNTQNLMWAVVQIKSRVSPKIVILLHINKCRLSGDSFDLVNSLVRFCLDNQSHWPTFARKLMSIIHV